MGRQPIRSRENNSTENALCRVTEEILKKLDEGKKVIGIFLDLQKAFDTVSHQILLERLERVGIRGIPNSLVKSYLSKRNQSVIISEDDFVKDISTQTPNAYEPEGNRILHGVITNPVNGELGKRRIAFIADHKGKGMASYIMSLAKEEFIIDSTVKSGASDRELADTVLNDTKNYNKNDLVIFWPNSQNRQITTELMMLKPQLIVITNPYEYSSNSVNDFVYNNNLEMKKHMFEAKKCSNVFECNTTLKRWHYRGDGYGFTGSAKWLMSKALVRYIHNYFQPVYTIAPDNLPKLITKSNPSMNVSLMSELQDAEQNANTKPSTNGTFSYPRLSQVAPDL
ncbi:hypothetical protein JTB14_005973 [Gonioctena quinquepunctata]|nr:hypothetical protein JTB14_005973 [Gonioctena quinquepunctata]